MEVRHARSKDVPAFASLAHDYALENFRSIGQDPPSRAAVHRFVEAIAAERIPGVQWIAVGDNGALGFATLWHGWSTLKAGPVGTLGDLYVLPGGRSAGVGSALFRAVEDYCRRRAYAYLTWETAADNSSGQRFYERMGARRDSSVVFSIETKKHMTSLL